MWGYKQRAHETELPPADCQSLSWVCPALAAHSPVASGDAHWGSSAEYIAAFGLVPERAGDTIQCNISSTRKLINSSNCCERETCCREWVYECAILESCWGQI